MRVWRNPAISETLLLFKPNATLGWSVSRRIAKAEGERGVERGSFRRVYDAITNGLLGYQMIGTAEQRGDQDISSQPSSASISMREVLANAGLMGASRTQGRAEDERARRDERTGRLLPMEDFIERAAAKVRVYPHVGAAQGDILRAWPR